MKKLQCANYVFMEIQNIHVLNHNASKYLCAWTSIEKKVRIREVVNTRIFRKIHCNLETIVNSLPPPRSFSQLEVPRKNHLSLPVYCAKSFNYYRKTERSIRLWCEVDYPINCVRKSHSSVGLKSLTNCTNTF